MRRLVALLRGRRSRRNTNPLDSEHLHRIYSETHRQVQDLRRAA